MFRYEEWYNRGFADPVGEFFERIIELTYRHILKKGDLAIDCGANRARHTLPMAECVGVTGKVIAIEAIPELARALRKTLPRHAKVVEKALTHECGEIEFNWVRACDGRSGIYPLSLRPEWLASIETIRVPSTTLDLVAPRMGVIRWWVPRVRFIKLDLEGGEYHAIQGGTLTVKRDAPFLVFENSRQLAAGIFGYTKENWFTQFANLGYSTYDLFGRPFSLSDWEREGIPWYHIAVKTGSDDERYVLNEHADRIATLLQRPLQSMKPKRSS
jgi:FkbM family methyltransferase